MSSTEEKDTSAQEAPAQDTPKQDTPKQDTPKQEPAAEDSLALAQVDGSGPPGNGSDLADTEFNVEVKLADMQADPNNPLFSAKSFEELQLYVARECCMTRLTPVALMNSSRVSVI